jgi:cellobiose phosphorylase
MVYVRDNKAGKYWTLNGIDGSADFTSWECTHGFGYSTIKAESEGIKGSITYLLPLNDPLEIWQVTLKNDSSDERSLSVFPFVLWDLAHTSAMSSSFDHRVTCEGNLIYAECIAWKGNAVRSSLPQFNRYWDRIAFMASSLPADGFDCKLAEFYGRKRGENAPITVVEGKCRNSQHRGTTNCGAFQHTITLKPNQEISFAVLVGYGRTREHIAQLVKTYNSVEAARKSLKEVHAFFDEWLGRIHMEFPDKDITTFANGWNRYQMYIRYCNKFHFRDTAQDQAAILAFDPGQAEKRIRRLLETQLRSGHAMHEIQEFRFTLHPSVNSDLCLWLPWLLSIYLKETDDWDYLDEQMLFFDGSQASVYEHLTRAIDYTLSQRGLYNLPLIKCGDWNDALAGSCEKGVSIWMAEFLHLCLKEMVQIANRSGNIDDAQRFEREAILLKKAINEHCWDGEWYVRAFDDFGLPIGSARDKEGRIWLNAQSWAVLSDVADERAITCMDSAYKHLWTEVGMPMTWPPFNEPEKRIGEFSRMPPGFHHNGGAWNHANAWAIIAECKLGRSDQALKYYKTIFPPRLSQNYPNKHDEPYGIASYTNTAPSGDLGGSGVAWNTGTVCWSYRALLEGFCGVRPDWDGLAIDPRLPSEWKHAKVKRPFRGNVFTIEIRNPKGVNRGVAEIVVDGKKAESNVISADPTLVERRVTVVMG